jgi:TolB protein
VDALSSAGHRSYPHLVAHDGDPAAQAVPIAGGLRIGRGGDNDVVVECRRVAHHHARIYRFGDGYVLCNERDAHQTWVNGASLIGHHPLRHGDRIVVGKREFVYREAPQPSATASIEPDPVPATTGLAPHAGDVPSTDWSGTGQAAVEEPDRATETGTGERAGDRSGLPSWLSPSADGPEARASTTRPRLSVVPTPAGLLLLAALFAVVAYLVAPEAFEGRRNGQRLTPSVTVPGPTPTRSQRAVDAREDTPASRPTAQEPTDEVALRLAEARALARRSRFEEAVARYEELAQQLPGDARPQAGWARALLLDGDLAQARMHAERAIELDPDSGAAWAAMAWTYVEAQQASEALSAARKAIALVEDDLKADAHAVLGEAYLLGGLWDEASAHLRLATEYDPGLAEAHRGRGQLYIATGDLDLAAVALRHAAELEPELWLRHQELGALLLETGDYEAAIVALTQALVLRHKPATYTTLGRAHYALDEYDQGKSFLEQSLTAGAQDAETYALLAIMNARQGRCDDARIYYGTALEKAPDHALALEARALCDGTPEAAGEAATAPAADPAITATATATATAVPGPALPGWIAFPVWSGEPGQYDTYIAHPDGSDRRLVGASMHQPAFRPDGRWLAVNGEGAQYLNLHVVRTDGSDLMKVTAYLEDQLPRWSPDGNSLVFSSSRHPDRQSRVYIMDSVPFDGQEGEDRPVRANLYEVLGDYPTWLPDGRILYTGCEQSMGAARCGLVAVSAAPGPQTPSALTDYPGDAAPAASADGHIAFMSDREGNWEVYVMNADGSGLLRLTETPANDGLPAWSPDGTYLAFVSDRDGAWAIWAIRPDATGLRKLFDLGGAGLAVDWQRESISWGP